MKIKKIFIAGPYSNGDVAQNVKLAMDTANQLIDLGVAPYCPHLTHFLHLAQYQPYEVWVNLHMAYLDVCDAILRLPGESRGADGEVRKAQKVGLPVFYSQSELINWLEISPK
jgi:hypothetical protein